MHSLQVGRTGLSPEQIAETVVEDYVRQGSGDVLEDTLRTVRQLERQRRRLAA